MQQILYKLQSDFFFFFQIKVKIWKHSSPRRIMMDDIVVWQKMISKLLIITKTKKNKKKLF